MDESSLEVQFWECQKLALAYGKHSFSDGFLGSKRVTSDVIKDAGMTCLRELSAILGWELLDKFIKRATFYHLALREFSTESISQWRQKTYLRIEYQLESPLSPMLYFFWTSYTIFLKFWFFARGWRNTASPFRSMNSLLDLSPKTILD